MTLSRWHEDLAAHDEAFACLQDLLDPSSFATAPAALDILQSIERRDDNPFVIVGAKPGTHLVNISKPWARLRKLAGLDGVRIHDLRHGCAGLDRFLSLLYPITHCYRNAFTSLLQPA